MGNTESISENMTTDPLEGTKEDIASGVNEYYGYKYNLVPSFPNLNMVILDDKLLEKTFNLSTEGIVPKYVDLRVNFPAILDIGELPLNPIYAVSYMLQYALLKQNLPVFPPSNLFIFLNCKFYRFSPRILTFETIFKSIRTNGFCSENDLRTNKDNINKSITESMKQKAVSHKFINVGKIKQDLDVIKRVLLSKQPILVGLTVYYSLNRITNAFWLPDVNIESIQGGIAGVIVGYMEDREVFIVAQTFGSQFGENGYILVPFEYILNPNYTFELYTLSLDKNRIEGYITQKIKLEETKRIESIKKEDTQSDIFSNLFS